MDIICSRINTRFTDSSMSTESYYYLVIYKVYREYGSKNMYSKLEGSYFLISLNIVVTFGVFDVALF